MGDELIFIGDKPNRKEMEIERKPDFYDIVFLSKHTPQKAPYQSIPIGTSKQVSIYFTEHSLHFIYEKNFFKIEGTRPVTSEEAISIFKNFAVREGNRVAYIAQCPDKPQKRKKSRTMETTKSVKV